MNKKQKQFINHLNKGIEMATAARDNLAELLSTGLANNASNREYLRELQAYIAAANKMKIATVVGFGKPSNQIAIETLASDNEN
jgi:uridine phosphorylase